MSKILGHMNNPPETFVSIDHRKLQGFVASVASVSGLSKHLAGLLAEILTGNDLLGNFSHGTQQIAGYARQIKSGGLNPDPNIQIVKETSSSILVDGDGGLGYFPFHEATKMVIRKALECGIAAGVSRNHGHFGAAGIYARMTLKHDLISFVTSGHQLKLQPGQPLFSAGGGSPMAFSAPADKEASLVLDFGTLHDLYAGDGHRDEIASLTPGLVFRCIGLGEVCQAWGGLLSGLSMDPQKKPWKFERANQGAMIVAMRIDLFDDPIRFKSQMDEYVNRVRNLQPLKGFNQSYMAGGREETLKRKFEKEGIPVGPRHQEALEKIGSELDVKVPW